MSKITREQMDTTFVTYGPNVIEGRKTLLNAIMSVIYTREAEHEAELAKFGELVKAAVVLNGLADDMWNHVCRR